MKSPRNKIAKKNKKQKTKIEARRKNTRARGAFFVTS
jgi:hypothetical protein